MKNFIKLFLLTIILGCLTFQAKAQNQPCNPQRGFFQKAYTDKGDPRFMISDESDNFKFGIGGTVLISTFYDFDGAVDAKAFKVFNIPVPTDKTGNFGLIVGGSKLNFKTVGKIREKELVSFVELGIGSDNTNITLRHAYVSYGGFTIGHTYSQFMDLDVGVQTVDGDGPNTQISRRQPIIAYNHYFNDHWKAAVSIEAAAIQSITNSSDWLLDNHYIDGIHYETDFQAMPDFTANVRYKCALGHVQLSGILRNLYYYGIETNQTNGKLGFGLALSGSLNTKICKLSMQTILGKGISQYVQDLNNADLDLIAMFKKDDVLDPKDPLTTAPIAGGYISAQFNISKELTSSMVIGYVDYIFGKDYICSTTYDNSYYGAVNIFWSLSDYCKFGAEYLYGERHNINIDGSKDSGQANRFTACVIYTF